MTDTGLAACNLPCITGDRSNIKLLDGEWLKNKTHAHTQLKSNSSIQNILLNKNCKSDAQAKISENKHQIDI